MKIILNLFILLSFINYTIPCDCFEKNTESVNKMYNDSEFIFIAETIENVHLNKDVKSVLDTKKEGTEVLMRIKKIIKGKIETENIITYQFNNGSCSKNFEFNKDYIIFGNQIKSFKSVNRSKNTIIENGEEIELPNSELKNSVLSIYNEDSEFVDFWNKKKNKSTIVNTSLCLSGIENGRLHKILMKIKK